MSGKLTKAEAISRLSGIINASDDEQAHSLEDKLFLLFIKSVASGKYQKDAFADEAVEVANIILESAALDFERWCG